MTVLSDAQWRQIESAYLNSTETIASIAERFSISPATIFYRRTKYDWPPRRAGAIKKKPKQFARVPVSDKVVLVARFYRLISLKLDQMEEDMTSSSERTPTDNERETRALGTLIRNFEKVFGLEQESSGNDDKGNGSGPERQAEADALRRELAERLVRLRTTEPDDDA